VMTQYMFMLFDDESWFDQVDEEAWVEAMKLHTEFTAAVAAAGTKITGGEALLRSSTATTVRNRPGADPLVTDGPFIETKEQMGGIVLMEVRDLDEAMAWAERCPGSYAIEIRPVMDYEAYARRAASAEGAAS
jgi:hypothetical protein